MTVLDPALILCSSQGCPATIAGRVAYYDSDHVAATTAASPRSLAIWTARLEQAGPFQQALSSERRV